MPLSLAEFKCVLAICWGNLTECQYPIQGGGGVAIILASSCYRTRSGDLRATSGAGLKGFTFHIAGCYLEVASVFKADFSHYKSE